MLPKGMLQDESLQRSTSEDSFCSARSSLGEADQKEESGVFEVKDVDIDRWGYFEPAVPEWTGGFIFTCTHSQVAECLTRGVFGMRRGQFDQMGGIHPRTLGCGQATAIFLFDTERRILYGLFEAASEPGLNIDPALVP